MSCLIHEINPRTRKCIECGIDERQIKVLSIETVMNKLTTEQEPPKPSNNADCWLLVLKDMEDRRQMGISKYGQPVMAGNGRDPLIDAYQEALDLCVYLRQAIEERKSNAPSKV